MVEIKKRPLGNARGMKGTNARMDYSSPSSLLGGGGGGAGSERGADEDTMPSFIHASYIRSPKVGTGESTSRLDFMVVSLSL